MSGASEWQEADNGEYVGEPENKDAEISKLKLDVLDSVTEENLNGITYSVADAEGNWNEYVTAGQETGFDSEQKIAAFKIKLTIVHMFKLMIRVKDSGLAGPKMMPHPELKDMIVA